MASIRKGWTVQRAGLIMATVPSRTGASAAVAACGVLLGGPQCREGAVRFAAPALLIVQCFDDRLGAPGLAQADEGVQQHRP